MDFPKRKQNRRSEVTRTTSCYSGSQLQENEWICWYRDFKSNVEVLTDKLAGKIRQINRKWTRPCRPNSDLHLQQEYLDSLLQTQTESSRRLVQEKDKIQAQHSKIAGKRKEIQIWNKNLNTRVLYVEEKKKKLDEAKENLLVREKEFESGAMIYHEEVESIHQSELETRDLTAKLQNLNRKLQEKRNLKDELRKTLIEKMTSNKIREVQFKDKQQSVNLKSIEIKSMVYNVNRKAKRIDFQLKNTEENTLDMENRIKLIQRI